MSKMNLIKCSNCGKRIESYGENEVSCRYCGKKTVIEKDDSDTDVMRTAQILNLEDTIVKNLYIRNIAFVETTITLVLGLFLVLFVSKNIPIMIIFFVLFCVSSVFVFLVQKRLEKAKSMKRDLTGGGMISDY